VTTDSTTEQNTAMLTLTIFLTGETDPPQNITIQGAHSFNNGEYSGSVSAASSDLAFLIGADVAGTPGTNGSLTLA